MSVRRPLALLAGAALVATTPALVGTASAATAAPSHARATAKFVATGGVTMLRLDAGTAGVLQANSISVAPASEARVTKSGITFPIQGGVLNTTTLAGKIKHSGGLTFTAGGKSLTVRSFTIDTARSRLTAYVDQVRARITLLKLDLSKAHVSKSSSKLGVRNVKATLSSAAAKALNSYYGVSLFKAGLAIGTARVSATGFVTK